jgi:hypothetical protein
MGATDVRAADINADGYMDVLSASNSDNTIAWYKNDGNQNFTSQTVSTGATAATSVFAADVDSDGDNDVLSSSGDNKIAWYENLSFQVINTNDSGPGSLRQAIATANAHPGLDTITFNIDAGVQTIATTSSLWITDPVIIDGTTQLGYAGTPLIVVTGVNAPFATGLTLFTGGNTVKGLVINGFYGAGITIAAGGNNLIAGNYIGTDATGSAAVPNGIGVSIGGSGSNIIGGTTVASRNVISGNGTGVWITNNEFNHIQGNYIGTDALGTSALGNTSSGVLINYFNNFVGGRTPETGNRIAFNGGAGVAIDTGDNNLIRHNRIYANGGLGIDLVNGGNGDQPSPALSLAKPSAGSTNVTATLVGTPSTSFTLDFYSSPVCDPSTFGEGETYLGTKTLTTNAAGQGQAVFVSGVQVPVGHVITATAMSPGHHTSEFSKCLTVPIGAQGTGTQTQPVDFTTRPVP